MRVFMMALLIVFIERLALSQLSTCCLIAESNRVGALLIISQSFLEASFTFTELIALIPEWGCCSGLVIGTLIDALLVSDAINFQRLLELFVLMFCLGSVLRLPTDTHQLGILLKTNDF